jgi:hypothetical protein
LAKKDLSDEQKLAAIKNICDNKTRDNYSCWLIPIDNVSINKTACTTQVIKADIENNDIKPHKSAVKKLSLKMCKILKFLILVIILAFASYYAYQAYQSFHPRNEHSVENVQQKRTNSKLNKAQKNHPKKKIVSNKSTSKKSS